MDRLHNWLRDHLNQSKTLHVSQDLLNVCRLAQYWSYCQHDPHRCRLTNPGSKSKFIQKELLQHACLQSYQWTLGIQRILPRRPPSKVQDLMKTLKELDHIQLCRIRYSGYEYQGCTPRPAPTRAKMAAPACPDPEKFQHCPAPPRPEKR